MEQRKEVSQAELVLIKQNALNLGLLLRSSPRDRIHNEGIRLQGVLQGIMIAQGLQDAIANYEGVELDLASLSPESFKEIKDSIFQEIRSSFSLTNG